MKTKNLAYAAVFAALYVVLTLSQNLLLPGTTSMAIQFRAAEALCVFALFTPSAIFGVSLGCLLFNLTFSGALPLDFLIGTAATLFSTAGMYLLRNLKVGKLPLLALLTPVIFNGLLVGIELTVYLKALPLWLNMLYVALGELGVMMTLGSALYFAFSGKALTRRLFGR